MAVDLLCSHHVHQIEHYPSDQPWPQLAEKFQVQTSIAWVQLPAHEEIVYKNAWKVNRDIYIFFPPKLYVCFRVYERAGGRVGS